MPKAIIRVEAYEDSTARSRAVAVAFDAGQTMPEADYHLSFGSIPELVLELTPRRVQILEVLTTLGPQSVHQLAKRFRRNYSAVRSDVARLEELGLISRDEGRILVPWDEIHIEAKLGSTSPVPYRE